MQHDVVKFDVVEERPIEYDELGPLKDYFSTQQLHRLREMDLIEITIYEVKDEFAEELWDGRSCMFCFALDEMPAVKVVLYGGSSPFAMWHAGQDFHEDENDTAVLVPAGAL